MADRDDEIIGQLENIGFLLGDLNHIRNGNYDPPQGSNPDSQRTRASTDDLSNQLSTVIGLLERQNRLLYNIGKNAIDVNDGDPAFWDDQNSD